MVITVVIGISRVKTSGLRGFEYVGDVGDILEEFRWDCLQIEEIRSKTPLPSCPIHSHKPQ